MAEPCNRGLLQHQAGQNHVMLVISLLAFLLGMVILIYVQSLSLFYFSLNVTSIFLWVINVDLGGGEDFCFFPTRYNFPGVKFFE